MDSLSGYIEPSNDQIYNTQLRQQKLTNYVKQLETIFINYHEVTLMTARDIEIETFN